MKKTIFITSCHPLISRNILSTGILQKLNSNNIQIVIIVPDGKIDYFENNFGDKDILIRSVKLKLTLRESFLRYLSLAALNTKTLNIKRSTEMDGSGKYFKYIASNYFFIKLIRKVELLSYRKYIFSELFDEFKPFLIFSTDIQNDIDVALMVESRKKGLRTIGMVRSWDNLTSKGLIRCIPHKILVWNNIIKEEAIKYHLINASTVSIIGIPHYDKYSKNDSFDKKSFFEKIGGDISKKILLYIPIGDRYLKWNNVDRDMVDILNKALPLDFQILVRLPPGDYVRGLEDKPNQFERINVRYDRVSKSHENIKQTEIKYDEDSHLNQTLFFSDIVVSGPSTMILDSIFMNKPVIIFGFDGYENKGYYDSVRRFYDYDNFKPVIESGGVKYAQNHDELIKYLMLYINDKNSNFKQRQELKKLEATFTDSLSTERLLNSLIN